MQHTKIQLRGLPSRAMTYFGTLIRGCAQLSGNAPIGMISCVPSVAMWGDTCGRGKMLWAHSIPHTEMRRVSQRCAGSLRVCG